MGLEEIIKNIDSDTKARAQLIVDEATAKADGIRKSAQIEADKITDAANTKAEADAKLLTTRELSKANIEAKGIYQEAVNGSIEESMELVRKNLAPYTSSDSYAKLLAKLAKMAVDELGADCTLYVQKKDVERLAAAKVTNARESKEQFIGGLSGVSADKMRSVDFTLEKILEGLRENIAVKLLDQIKE